MPFNLTDRSGLWDHSGSQVISQEGFYIFGRMTWIAALAISLSSMTSANAATTTVTFDSAVAPTASYTESGMTFTSVSGSLFEVSSGFGGFGWNVPCCPGGTDQFDLTTGGIFNFDSIDVLHADSGDPIVFEGFLGGGLVGSFTIANGVTGTYNFPTFMGIDLLRITASGNFSDPTFDNLVYSTPSAVPLPASLPLLLGAFGFAGYFGRRRRSA